MILECLGSSSSGNCYLLHSDEGVLIIECGIPMLEVKKALNWEISKIVGCIVSHEHNDHAKYISEYTKCGIKVYALADVFAAKNLTDNIFCKSIRPKHGYRIGQFDIVPLSVDHDVPCLGFVITHREMGRLLFVTDTMMLKYRVSGLNHIMIEANYSDKILNENIEQGIVPPSMRQRLLKSHMELETTIGVLKANDLDAVSEIVLLHLSSNNADLTEFRERVIETIGLPTYIARKGVKINLSKELY